MFCFPFHSFWALQGLKANTDPENNASTRAQNHSLSVCKPGHPTWPVWAPHTIEKQMENEYVHSPLCECVIYTHIHVNIKIDAHYICFMARPKKREMHPLSH